MKKLSDHIITIDFKDDFIEKLVLIVKHLNREKGISYERLAIVFGGRRPSLYVKRGLARSIGKSFISPRFFTIDDFVGYALRKNHAPENVFELENCYLLYKIVQKNMPEILTKRENFAQFLPWAREILKFIEQLDLEHIGDKQLLSIKANAEIGYEVPEDINTLLSQIFVLRKEYHRELLKNGQFTRGLQYLEVAQDIGRISFDEFDRILFCNFFYFHKSQELIVKHLFKSDKATLIFQGDERKWPIFKRLGKSFNVPIQEKNLDLKPSYNLKLYAGFDVHSQVGIVCKILQSINHLDQTVLVLPNPDSIVPLVSEITSIVEDFNISMGYPLKRSSLYNLLQFIFQAQLSIKGGRYYAKDYLKVLRHPFVKNFKETAYQQATRFLIYKIEEALTGKMQTRLSGSAFVDLTEIEGLDEIYEAVVHELSQINIEMQKEDVYQLLLKIHQLMFVGWEKISNFSHFSKILKYALEEIIQKSRLKEYPLNINIALRMFHLIDEFDQTSFSNEVFDRHEIFKIFETRVSTEIIAFKGSPIKGLQVLGLFETRSLNFKNVIILETNEGVLPKLNIYDPLIPREVMVSLGLDRLEYEEEIQRYQFMRLISSATNVHLVYEESKDKERSRFIEELLWEGQKANEGIFPVNIHRAGYQVSVKKNTKVIKKTKEVVEFLKEFSFSASSINSYLKDPMEFYYTYVLGLREKENLLDEPEAKHVGTFIHALLEEGFRPFLGEEPKITGKFRKQFMALFSDRFSEKFEKLMKSDAFLLKSIIKERLERFLDQESDEKSRKVEQIVNLESYFNDTIPLECGDIKFSYIIDRIDRMKNGTMMVIDYKTGSIDQIPKEFDKICTIEFSRDSILEEIQSFQIPLYFHYLNKTYPDLPINAAIYNLRTLKINKFLDEKMMSRRQEIDAFFLKALNYVVSEILNPQIDFISSEQANG